MIFLMTSNIVKLQSAINSYVIAVVTELSYVSGSI